MRSEGELANTLRLDTTNHQRPDQYSGEAGPSPGPNDVKVLAASTRKSRKGPTTRTACARCRKSKVKCDGKHPSCSRCLEHNEKCVYDVPEEGMTRMQFMHIELQRKTRECQAMLGLLEFLRSKPEPEAADLLARLRMGEDLESLVKSFVGIEQLETGSSPWSFDQRPSIDFGESAVSPELLDPSIPPFALPDDAGPSSVYDPNTMPTQVHMMTHVNNNADPQQVARMMDEVERLRYGRTGMPQVSFNGIQWQ